MEPRTIIIIRILMIIIFNELWKQQKQYSLFIDIVRMYLVMYISIFCK